MKPIKHTARFTRHFHQRIAHHESFVEDFLASVEAFQTDRASVGDHPLAGKMGLQRAFWINDAYRVVYFELKAYFLFDDIGTHDQVYQR